MMEYYSATKRDEQLTATWCIPDVSCQVKWLQYVGPHFHITLKTAKLYGKNTGMGRGQIQGWGRGQMLGEAESLLYFVTVITQLCLLN